LCDPIPLFEQEVSCDSLPVQPTSSNQICPEPDPNLHAQDNDIDCSDYTWCTCSYIYMDRLGHTDIPDGTVKTAKTNLELPDS